MYLILSSQVKAWSSIAGKSAHAVDAKIVFKDTFNDLIRVDLSIGTEKYQGVLEDAFSKGDFSVRAGVYVLPSNLNLNNGKREVYNNKILLSNTDMKIGSNSDINRDCKKLTPQDVPKRMIFADRYKLPEIRIPHNLKMLAERHNDEKLAITLLIFGAGLIAYHSW